MLHRRTQSILTLAGILAALALGGCEDLRQWGRLPNMTAAELQTVPEHLLCEAMGDPSRATANVRAEFFRRKLTCKIATNDDD